MDLTRGVLQPPEMMTGTSGVVNWRNVFFYLFHLAGKIDWLFGFLEMLVE